MNDQPTKKSLFDRLSEAMKSKAEEVHIKEEPAKEGQELSQPSWMEQAQAEGQLALDVYQTDAAIIIQSTVAGVTEKDLDISITNDMVTIKGQRSRPSGPEIQNYFLQECYWGPFSRTVILPVDVVAEQASGELKNGVLTIVLPKAAKEKTHKIQIKES